MENHHFKGKTHYKWAIFYSYVSLPEDIGNVVTPTDELIFFRGVGIPPTRNGEEEQPIIKRISSPITLFGRCAEDKANKECLLVKKTNSELLGLWCIYTIYTVYSCLLLM